MKHLLVASAFLWASVSSAAMGVLVSSSTETVGGKLYWNCVYDVLGKRVSQLIPIERGPCPPTINM